MRAASLATIAVAAIVLLAPAGCGGDGNEEAGDAQAQQEQRASAAVLARANANCRRFLRDAQVVAAEAFSSGEGNLIELATEHVVKPSIPLLERVAQRQQALARSAGDPRLSLYADLFDPIIVLAEERLRSGQAAIREGGGPEIQRSREIEDLMTELGADQRQAARDAGLPACTADFRKALVASLTG